MKESPRYDLSIIGTVGLPASYGGFETLTEQLTQRLANQLRIQVFCSGKRYPKSKDRPERCNGAYLHYVDLDANGWQSIPYDFVSLLRGAYQSRTLLVLGVSGCLMLPVVRLIWPRTRIVTNVDGLEWKRKKWGLVARCILRASEWIAVHFSHAVIADNQGIQEHIIKSYRRQSHLIAYGGDQTDSSEEAILTYENTTLPDTRFASGNYFFGVCRIEPENHIAEILMAFSEMPQANLVLVGNWNVSDYARQLYDRHCRASNIELKYPIYQKARMHALRTSAKAYVHGHSAGGTNPSLVEAMHAGMPVVAFDVNYNRHTTHNQAIYWEDAPALTERIRLTTDTALHENAVRMAEIARQCYTWEIVTQQYADVFFLEK